MSIHFQRATLPLSSRPFMEDLIAFLVLQTLATSVLYVFGNTICFICFLLKMVFDSLKWNLFGRAKSQDSTSNPIPPTLQTPERTYQIPLLRDREDFRYLSPQPDHEFRAPAELTRDN